VLAGPPDRGRRAELSRWSGVRPWPRLVGPRLLACCARYPGSSGPVAGATGLGDQGRDGNDLAAFGRTRQL